MLIDGKISAFHERRKVALKYMKHYKRSNLREKIELCRMLKVDAKKEPNYDDYYLVPVNLTYIQQKYAFIVEIEVGEEYQHKSGLIKQLDGLIAETSIVKERHALLEIQEKIKQNRYRVGTYTPSLSMLQNRYWDYEQYRSKGYD